MKNDLIRVYKKLENGKEVELLADEKQIPILSTYPEFRIPETKKIPQKKENGKEVESKIPSKDTDSGSILGQNNNPDTESTGAEGQ
ncbi:hypothetical protein [Leptospira santarosai]|uniref:Uncharacterized protein n=1 Tax=Leptospira santarosai str. ZUN179 TaxID=1049985 RepID=M6ULY3_9LEPT|nr:hypothetical protein [Leptospira santarosai]EMO43821.1 hypothetical protein LEP1GSC187_0516 [Leptospira santarosai str. ZUN179]MDO6383428.1 hypothetical protein [Leptospira santarosai]